MENQYYRKPRQKIKGWFKKELRKKNVVLTLLIAVPAFLFVMFSNKGIIQRLNLESKKKEMIRKVFEVQREQEDLQKQWKLLDTDLKTIEKIARERYGMVKEGETVYKVRKEKKES